MDERDYKAMNAELNNNTKNNTMKTTKCTCVSINEAKGCNKNCDCNPSTGYSKNIKATPVTDDVDEYITQMVKDDPIQVIQWMLIVLGRDMLNMNAETLDLSQESDLRKDARYKIDCHCKISKI